VIGYSEIIDNWLSLPWLACLFGWKGRKVKNKREKAKAIAGQYGNKIHQYLLFSYIKI